MEKYKAFKTKYHDICLVPLEFLWKKPNTIYQKDLKKATWTNHHQHLAQDIKVAAPLWE